MASPESEFLQGIGIKYLRSVVHVSIFIFFYGASSGVLVRALRLTQKFGVRGVCCTLLCIGPYLFVRSLLPKRCKVIPTRADPRNFTGGKDFLTAR